MVYDIQRTCYELGTHTFYYSLKTHPEEVTDIKEYVSLFESQSGAIWVLSVHDIRKFDPVTHEVTLYELTHPQNTLPLVPNSIQQLANGNIYIGTNDNYLVEINPASGETQYLKILESQTDQFSVKIIASDVFSLIVASENKVYVLDTESNLILRNSFFTDKSHWALVDNMSYFEKGSSGFYNYNNVRYKYHYLPTINKHIAEIPHAGFAIPKILVSSIFLLQVSSDTVALFQVKKSNNGLRLHQQSKFTFKTPIHDMHMGNQKIVWLSSFEEIHKLVLQKKQFTTHISNNSSKENLGISSIVKNSSGSFFIASKRGIFSNDQSSQFVLLDLKNRDEFQNKKQPYFKDLWLENDSIVWGVNESNSPYKINLKDKTFSKVFGEDQFHKVGSHKFIHVAAKDTNQLTLGCLGGLYSYDAQTHTIRSENHIIQGIDFTGRSVFDTVENDTYFWVASVIGLYGINKKTNKPLVFSSDKGSPFPKETKFLLLYLGSDNFLWAGTNQGLFKVDQKNLKVVQHYDVKSGLTDSNIQGIQESGDFIWVTTSNGLSKINQLDGSIQNFHKNEGLLDNEFLRKSFYKASDTLFYAGSSRGLVSFDPTKVNRTMDNYSVFPVELRYFDKDNETFFSVTSDFEKYQSIDLPSQYSSLFFSFAMNDLISPKLNKIFYRISSLSKEWNLLDSNATVKLYGLQSGQYTLEVKGTSELGSPSQNILSYTIKVPYPFYFQWWFIFVFFSVVALVLYLWFYFEATVIKINRDRYLQISNLELRAYQAQMNPHFIFNALNGLQSTMVLHGEVEFNNYMSSFSKLIRHTIEMSNAELITINKEIEYLQNYVELQSLRLDSKINLKITVQKPIVSSFVYIPCMILQPIVENSILHGLIPSKKEKNIEIHFFLNEGSLNCQIRDNGIGREAAQKRKQVYQSMHQSFATTILNKRIKLLNSQNKGQFFFKIEDLYDSENQPEGTLVTIGIPSDYEPKD